MQAMENALRELDSKILIVNKELDEKKSDWDIDDISSTYNSVREMDFLLKNIAARCKISVDARERHVNLNLPCKEVIDSFEIRFNKLLKSLEMEGFNKGNLVYSSILECKQEVINAMDWEAAFKRIKFAMDNVRPFDIEQLLELDRKTLEAANQTRGKDILLVLGMLYMYTHILIDYSLRPVAWKTKQQTQVIQELANQRQFIFWVDQNC